MSLQAFYARLDQFLCTVALEEPTRVLGCSEAEIAAQEHTYGVRFPLAYRLFLKWCGRTTLKSLDQDFQLDFLEYYWGSARDLLAENQAVLEPGGFVFGEWQGYNFFYFLLGSDNPPVKLCMIKSDTEPGLEYTNYGRFTNWLIDRIKSMVEIRQSIRKINVDVPAVWAELDQIALVADYA
ncbi:SMI1/KNR4 family protein [Hymenobacter cellulosilyticus]|uniref:SMI1/KNR4 family protein n=1 Tax=Hymenobacter cellulosilyticus TaxID=2932248 RepID=A0A8T9Q476_9BACT|nr:SMI1/KNR4 family protein [Hymenobacter cellulosilyticus]UOQ70698.1 SMI1/KNR4 family protein [Hymenobacter cellulosilyticus]